MDDKLYFEVAKVRFADKFTIAESGCHVWNGAKSPSKDGKHPYGVFLVRGRLVMAHRFAYEMELGVIPKGLVIDHLCRNTLCVNPKHLEPVTSKENINRGSRPQRDRTHCPHGHPYEGDNLYVTPKGHRRCIQCRNDQLQRHYVKRGHN